MAVVMGFLRHRNFMEGPGQLSDIPKTSSIRDFSEFLPIQFIMNG
jgi:hypothetical protein